MQIRQILLNKHCSYFHVFSFYKETYSTKGRWFLIYHQFLISWHIDYSPRHWIWLKIGRPSQRLRNNAQMPWLLKESSIWSACTPPLTPSPHWLSSQTLSSRPSTVTSNHLSSPLVDDSSRTLMPMPLTSMRLTERGNFVAPFPFMSIEQYSV